MTSFFNAAALACVCHLPELRRRAPVLRGVKGGSSPLFIKPITPPKKRIIHLIGTPLGASLDPGWLLRIYLASIRVYIKMLRLIVALSPSTHIIRNRRHMRSKSIHAGGDLACEGGGSPGIRGRGVPF